MYFYFYEGSKVKTESAVIQLAKDFIDSENLPYDLPVSVKKNENGKPYFEDSPIYFSVSHSMGLWICAMGLSPLGADIQVKRKLNAENAEKISERFFTRDEANYVRLWGDDGFFDLWARKESYVKLKGTGFSKQGFNTFSVLDTNGNLAETIEGNYVYNIDIAPEIVCVVLCEKKENVIFREVCYEL